MVRNPSPQPPPLSGEGEKEKDWGTPPTTRQKGLRPLCTPPSDATGEGEQVSQDPMEAELALAIMDAAMRASELEVRVGVADGKFAAYVAAVMGRGDHALTPPHSQREREHQSAIPHIVPAGEGQAFLADLSIEDLPVS